MYDFKHQEKETAMQIKPLFIRVEWDEEAQVWVATSDDVPGLATEEETINRDIQPMGSSSRQV